MGLALIAAGEVDRGGALIAAALRDADAMPKTDQGWARNQSLSLLGSTLADADAHLPALECLKTCSAKNMKAWLVGRVASAYARAGDSVGASMVLGYVPATELNGLMNACDALHALAGRSPPFVRYA